MPAKIDIEFKEPTRSTHDRIMEIKFYLLYLDMKRAFKNRESSQSDYIKQIISFGSLNPTTLHVIEKWFEHFTWTRWTPTKVEVAMAIHYDNMPVHRTCERTKVMTPKTYYIKLREYDDMGQPDFAPMVDDSERAVLIDFMRYVKAYAENLPDTV